MTISLNRSHILALIIALLLVIWVASGAGHAEEQTQRSLTPASDNFSVGFRELQPETREHRIQISAHVAANRAVDVVAEVSGKITDTPAVKGTRVKKGDLLLEIDQRDLPERLKQAEAQLKRRQLETESTRNLFKRDLTNQSAVVLAESELAEAEAALTAIRLDLQATRIRAPFDGTYDQRYVEAGEYVSPGKALVRVVDDRTMLVKGSVSENDIRDISSGQAAYATLQDGARIPGKLSFVARSASPDTRTYPVEMTVQGNENTLFDGQTATLFLPRGDVDAYLVSPALLVITDHSGLGLKVLDADDRVQLIDVQILEAGTDGVWVFGPTGPLRLITSGQGFVDIGDKVNAVNSEPSVTDSGAEAQASDETAGEEAADKEAAAE